MGFKVVGRVKEKKKRERVVVVVVLHPEPERKRKKKGKIRIVRVEVGKWQFISKMMIIINTSTRKDEEVHIIIKEI